MKSGTCFNIFPKISMNVPSTSMSAMTMLLVQTQTAATHAHVTEFLPGVAGIAKVSPLLS